MKILQGEAESRVDDFPFAHLAVFHGERLAGRAAEIGGVGEDDLNVNTAGGQLVLLTGDGGISEFQDQATFAGLAAGGAGEGELRGAAELHLAQHGQERLHDLAGAQRREVDGAGDLAKESAVARCEVAGLEDELSVAGVKTGTVG